MRRRPRAYYLQGQHPLNLASPPGPNPPAVPSSAADVIEPYFAEGGGITFYPTGYDDGAPRDPAVDAVQLVCEQYVPPGRSAWIKRIEIAPCAPPVLVDPWRGWDATFNLFQSSPNPLGSVQRAPAQAGLWETPMAWEGYFSNPVEGFPFPPFWRWVITLFDGNVAKYRSDKNIPPFNPTVPASWELAINVPVPRAPLYGPAASAQPNLPGRTVPGYIGPQRYQATPSNPLPVHILVPENTTILLWAYWRQAQMDPVLAFGPNGPLEPWSGAPPGMLPRIYPLLPSVGRLIGYQQPATRPAAMDNAEHGWGA